MKKWLIIILLVLSHTNANAKFTTKYSCTDTVKKCSTDHGPATKVIDGFPVYKDCWQYEYEKTCNVPSKDDCAQYSDCADLGERECLLYDQQGRCLNQKKEFSCEVPKDVIVKKKSATWSPASDSAQAKQLVCQGMPCVDGNCVDKSYERNGEMMSSISRLYAVMEGTKGGVGSNLFPGAALHCTKKAADYSNCCSLGGDSSNWGHSLGAKCSRDENILREKRQKNMCYYTEKTEEGGPLTPKIVKHYYCCFGNKINKAINEQAKDQLNIKKDRGCRGLTLEELSRVDFDRLDLSEAYADILENLQLPNAGDIDARAKGVISNGDIKEDDKSNKSGINNNFKNISGE